MHELILGGQRSGKSRCAESRARAWLAAAPGRSALLIATALAADAEMAERIARHRADRAQSLPELATAEVPWALGEALRQASTPERLVVVDCLTLWLTNWRMPPDGSAPDGRPVDETPAHRSRLDQTRPNRAPVDGVWLNGRPTPCGAAAEHRRGKKRIGGRRRVGRRGSPIAPRSDRRRPGPIVFVSNEIGLGITPLGADARRFVDELGRLHQAVAAACPAVTLMVAGIELPVKRGRRIAAGLMRMAFAIAFPFAFAAAFAMAALAGGANATPVAAEIELRDDRGTTVRLPAVPVRIVSLLPSLTESVCALGACGSLVGTDRYSNFPASVVALPKLGGIDDAQVERIVRLQPDVVLAAAGARVTERLESLGLRVLVLESRNRAEVEHSLLLLAAMLGRPEAASRVLAAIDRETEAAAGRVPPQLRGRRVYFEIDSTPYAAGAGSFIGETLARLGMVNAVPAALGPFPRLNPEFIVRSQPDIIIAGERDLATMAQRPGWSSLRALQHRQTCGFPADRFELLFRPGPRIGEAASLLADCLARLATGK